MYWINGVERILLVWEGVVHGSRHWKVSGVHYKKHGIWSTHWVNAMQTCLYVYSPETSVLELLIVKLCQSRFASSP
jgi:hypothetical protein